MCICTYFLMCVMYICAHVILDMCRCILIGGTCVYMCKCNLIGAHLVYMYFTCEHVLDL